MWTWLISHTWRELIGAGALLGLIVGYVCWSAHERGIGEKRLEAAQAAEQAEAQALADKVAVESNAKVQADYAAASKDLPTYLQRYAEPVLSTDCAPVKYERKTVSK